MGSDAAKFKQDEGYSLPALTTGEVARAVRGMKAKTAMGFDAMKAKKIGAGKMDKGFYRKGKVGDWRRHFTVEQNQHANDVCNRRLRGVTIAEP